MPKETKYRIELTAAEIKDLTSVISASSTDAGFLGASKPICSAFRKIREADMRRIEHEIYMEQFPRSKDANI